MKLIIDASNISIGGGVTHLIEILGNANIDERNFSSVVLYASDKTLKKLPKNNFIQYKTHQLLNNGYFSRYLWYRFVLKKVLKESDILFIPGTGYLRTNATVITMCQNLLPFAKDEMRRYFPSLTWVRLKMLSHYHKLSYAKSDGVIFLNEYCLKKVNDSGVVPKSFTIIPHGVNPIFSAENKAISSTELKLLYVSTVDVYKHQWIIAEAVLELNLLGYPISVHFVGSKQEKSTRKLYSVINSPKYRKYKSMISVTGEVEYFDLKKIYADADIFIYGSTCETFGMTLLEAMRASKPIICSNKSSMSEMLKDGGIYYDPESVEETKTAILQLYDDPELAIKLSQRAYQLSLKYDWNITTKKTFEYLSSFKFSLIK